MTLWDLTQGTSATVSALQLALKRAIARASVSLAFTPVSQLPVLWPLALVPLNSTALTIPSILWTIA